jgi:hypothetical protein
VSLSTPPGWAADPLVLDPPGRVVVRHEFPFAVSLSVTLAGEVGPAPEGAELRFRVLEPAPLYGPRTHTWRVQKGIEPSGIPPATLSFRVPAPTGRLRIGGEGIVEATVEFSGLSSSSDDELEVELRLQRWTVGDRTSSEESTERPLRITAPSGAPRIEEVQLWIEDGGSTWTWDADSGTGSGTLSGEAGWVAAFSGEWFAGPERVAPLGPVRLDLARGGYLVVVPTRLAPLGLGEPWLERADRGKFFRLAGDAVEVSSRARILPGEVLGPLPAGEATFRIHLGGRVMGEVSAVVVAGEHRPLVIPALRPPGSSGGR